MTDRLVLDTDAARRSSDAVRAHIAEGQAGRWVALRLSDGGSDGIAYDTRQNAIRHQLHETQCAYVKVPMDDLSPRAAAALLRTHRAVYDAGLTLADPDDPRELITPDRRW